MLIWTESEWIMFNLIDVVNFIIVRNRHSENSIDAIFSCNDDVVFFYLNLSSKGKLQLHF